MADLEHTTILIVGGGSGMGLALARHCLEAKAAVVIASRNSDKLAAARMRLCDPPKLDTMVVDVTSERQVSELFDKIGKLDHIVSTAADIDGSYELLPALDLAAAQRAVESKIYGPLLLAKHGSEKLSAAGSMTFVSGIAAYRPSIRGAVVASVNAAIEGLVRALAVEVAPVRVNAVSPGWVDTEIWNYVAGEQKGNLLRAMADRLPVGRIGEADDVAAAIAFLMTNGFTTGTVLHVEGGHRLI